MLANYGGKDLWKRWVLSLEWNSECVMEGESGWKPTSWVLSQTHPQTGSITIHCVAARVQCNGGVIDGESGIVVTDPQTHILKHTHTWNTETVKITRMSNNAIYVNKNVSYRKQDCASAFVSQKYLYIIYTRYRGVVISVRIWSTCTIPGSKLTFSTIVS